jgi:ABC-type dipeptide/oligopeptide/nickel transport system ATPase subunit
LGEGRDSRPWYAPGYLICDELSSMLDVSTQAARLQTIAGRAHVGVLPITHHRVLADAWCDDVQQIDGHRSRVVAG